MNLLLRTTATWVAPQPARPTVRAKHLADRRVWVPLCAGMVLALGACHGASKGADVAPMFTEDHGLLTVPAGSPLRSHLAVQTVSNGSATDALVLPAAVEADPARVANVLAPLTGRVIALKVALGEHVRRGQTLAILASGDFAQAYSDDEKARDAADLAKKSLDRAHGVGAAGGAAQKDLEAAASAYIQAAAERLRAHTRLIALGAGRGGHSRDLVLTAPQSGVVTTLAIASGAQVNDPTATLMTVTNLDRVFVTANVAEGDIDNVALGDIVDIALTATPDKVLKGRISEVNAVIEPDTRRRKVRIALSNLDGRLMPNMYATVRVSTPSASGVVAPQSALLMNNDTVSVLVEMRPWVFQRRIVRIGDETEATARILSGLQAGDRVVVRGGVLLND